MAANTHTIDRRGDLWLLIKASKGDNANTEEFQVCSRTLARASPVFDTLLFGPFAEAKQPKDEKWCITLHGDDATAMKILLQMMHGHTDSVQVIEKWTDEEIEGLYYLIVAADKYQCVFHLKAWAGAWIGSIPVHLMISPKNRQSMLQLSWICYQLGSTKGYIFLARRIFETYPADQTTAPDMVVPPELFPNIFAVRLARKQAVLDLVSKAVEDLRLQRPRRPKYCESKSANPEATHDCEMSILGSLISNLSREQLYPVPKASAVTFGQTWLCAKVKKILLTTREWGHKYCCAVARIDYELSREQVVDGVLKKINHLYTPSEMELEFVAAQATMLGMDTAAGEKGHPAA